MLTPTAIHPDRVAVYIRWSTDDQGEGTTLAVQRERCIHYLQSQGWHFSERLLFVDDGYSGGTLDRPALTRLRAEVAAGRVECVVVYKIDRLSRSVVDIVDLVLREWEGRCFVKSTTEEINTLTPAGKVFFYVLISFAEYERSVIRERTMGGKLKRAEQGLNPGFRPPFGYSRGASAGQMEPVEHEASLVKRVFQLYRQGYGPGQIAGLLNGEGLLHRGRPWSRLAIRRMLANPVYAGILQYGRQGQVRRRAEGAFPAIVDRQQWEEVQQRLGRQAASRRTAPTDRPASRPAGLLAGLARCRCGAVMGAKRVGVHRYYYCTARRRHGGSVCAAGHVPAAPVEAALVRRIKNRLLGVRLEPPLSALAADLVDRQRELGAALRQERLRLAGMAERRRRIEQDYRQGALPAHLYGQEWAALEVEEEQLRRRVDGLERRLSRIKRAEEELVRLPWPSSSAELWELLSAAEQKELLRRATRRIALYRASRSGEPPSLEVEWIDRGED